MLRIPSSIYEGVLEIVGKNMAAVDVKSATHGLAEGGEEYFTIHL